MKIVKILGGLGNQMFQYAFAYSIRDHGNDKNVLLDLHGFNGYNKHNGYELGRLFQPKMKLASLRELSTLAYPYFNYNIWRIGSRILPIRKSMIVEDTGKPIDTKLLTLDLPLYYDGYWQSEDYFKDIRAKILEEFQFPAFTGRNAECARLILGHNTLSIHVRRGDFLNKPLYTGIGTLDYYKNAIRKMNDFANIDHVIVFSNDIKWCQLNLCDNLPPTTEYIDWNTGLESYNDMHLMSLCKYNIIANSSFSWWGAWLNNNPNKIVVCPQRWDNSHSVQNPICNDWIRINSL